MRFNYKGKRYKLNTSRAVVLAVVVVALLDLLFVGSTKTYRTPEGDYECRGGLIQVCSTDSDTVYKKYSE